MRVMGLLRSTVQRALGVRQRLGTIFAARDVILRSDGRIRYLRLSTRKQVALCAAAIVIGTAAVGASIGMTVQQLSMHNQQQAVRKADDAYTQLLKDVTGYFDQFTRSTDAASNNDSDLLGLSNAESAARRQLLTSDQVHFWTIGAADPERQQALRETLRQALKLKLASFDTDLKHIAARNAALNKEVAASEARAEDVTTARDELTVERDALAQQLAAQQGTNHTLSDQVARLTGSVGQLDAQLQIESGKSLSLTQQLATLQQQLDLSKAANADLALQVAQSQRALATVIAQRNQLQNARTDMAGAIEDLKLRLASLQESQANFVSHLTQRARQNLEDMEKTVQMTGLSVDQLIRLTDEQSAAQGGPFIPALTDTKDANERKLLESVATLDDEVGRWEKLQVILRSMPLSAPVDHYYISSGFGERMDPFNGETAIHEGLDLVDAIHSDILATAPGKVVFAGWRGSYGRCIEIDHGLGIHTVYAHLDSVLVKEGDLVDYRQTIGKLGNSGRSSGAHVHYEVRFEDKPLDPMGFLKAGRYVFKG